MIDRSQALAHNDRHVEHVGVVDGNTIRPSLAGAVTHNQIAVTSGASFQHDGMLSGFADRSFMRLALLFPSGQFYQTDPFPDIYFSGTANQEFAEAVVELLRDECPRNENDTRWGHMMEDVFFPFSVYHL